MHQEQLNGFKMTRQRKVILDELAKSSEHPSAAMLYEKLRRRMPRLSLGTVYRNLEQISAAGLITKLEFGGCERRFDYRTERHHHVLCLGCGQVADVDEAAVSSRAPIGLTANGQLSINDLATEHAGPFQLVGLRMCFEGYCPSCREKSVGRG